MMFSRMPCAMAWLLSGSVAMAANERPQWIEEGPYVDDDVIAFEVPVRMVGNQVLVEVEIGGAPRRFLFDTGSPSMMSAELAAELELEAVDRRQSRDSHGAVVETEIMQTDIAIAGTTFRKVPVFVAEFPQPVQCFFDGVLGSEVLPLCAWQIDLSEHVLRCRTDVESMQHIANASRLKLYDYGYPHAPFIDVRFSDRARSKALFDSGSPEYMSLSPPDLEGAERNGGVGKRLSGQGSLGSSIGGPAPAQEQLMVELISLSIGTAPDDVELGRVFAPLRESPPSLVGASILQYFVVTLDTKNEAAYFDPFRPGPFDRGWYGFSLSFDEVVSVSMVWSESPASEAGLQVGQQVHSINGAPGGTSCTGVREAMQAIWEGDSIDIGWQGGSATLRRASRVSD